MKIGHGYDVHRFGGGFILVLGGIHVEHECGLIAHSDGDVICHALCDSLLGAAGMRDIGNLFPDSDPTYKGISSILLLKEVTRRINEKGFTINCADITVIADKPKLAKYIPSMIVGLASAMNISPDRVNIKATTEEGLGLAGKGVGCHAVCLLNESGD